MASIFLVIHAFSVIIDAAKESLSGEFLSSGHSPFCYSSEGLYPFHTTRLFSLFTWELNTRPANSLTSCNLNSQVAVLWC
jgi:hypothetical protein